MKSIKHNADEAQKFTERKRGTSDKPKMLVGRVMTADGPGTVTGHSFRRNTNGGPGCKQYVVRLDDGRVRHYSQVGSA
jgi:hypothetical protein